MARRKRVFTSKRGGEVFWGGRRRTLSFPEMESPSRKAGGFRRQMKKLIPAPVKRWLGKIRGIHVVVTAVLATVAAFLVWFLAFVLPAPISGVSPRPDSHVRSKEVSLEVRFKRDLKKEDATLTVDGQNVTGSIRVDGKRLTCSMGLKEGKHFAEVVLRSGGLMGKRSKQWTFTVDTTPPELKVARKKITEMKGARDVEVAVSGKTEKGASVRVGGTDAEVGENGGFRGRVSASRNKSVRVTASDAAGNKTSTYIVTQKPTEAKGVHVSVYVAGNDHNMGKMIGLVKRTELNALQIDLKDEKGQIASDIDNRLAQEIGSTTEYFELDACVDRLRSNGIYAICRVVVFKDPTLAEARPGYAVMDKYGGRWGKGLWVDPYSREVWDYNIAVAEAAAKAGFNEIQFDYIRFPSDGDTTTCLYPGKDDRSQREVIRGFLEYARERLSPYNVFISADLFGLTASKQGEMGIGQRVKDVALAVDYISPMVYPSHYNPGEYNIKSPENNPGDTVSASLADFKKEVAGTGAKLRPWLQDFSLRVTYTPDFVRRQIDATESAGINEWLLWDPHCTYSESALKPAR